jgi:hypothetical protein
LDLRTGGYYVFDSVGTAMWKASLSTIDGAEALQGLLEKFSVERGRLEADLAAFQHQCMARGFLQEEEPQARSDLPLRAALPRRRFLTLRAWWCLFRTTCSLAVYGFARTYERYSRLSTPAEDSDRADAMLAKALAAFSRAENLFSMKRAPRDCVPRSLALFHFLRLAGLPAEHCIGVRRSPFEAHAWVECEGRVVHDLPSRQLRYTTLARISR